MAGGGGGHGPGPADALSTYERKDLAAIASAFREDTAGMSQVNRDRLGAELINQYMLDTPSDAPSTLIHAGHSASSLTRTVLGLLREDYTPEAGTIHVERVAPKTANILKRYGGNDRDDIILRRRTAAHLPRRFAGRSATILQDTSRSTIQGYQAFTQALAESVKHFHLGPTFAKARTLNDHLAELEVCARIVSSQPSPLYDPDLAEEAEASQRVDVYVNSTSEKHRPEWNSIMLQTQKRNGFDHGPLVIPRIAGIHGHDADYTQSVLYNVTPFEIEEADVYVEIVGRGFGAQSYRRAIQALDINDRAKKPFLALVDSSSHMAVDGNEFPKGFLSLLSDELIIPYRQPDVAGHALNDALDQVLFGRRAKAEIDKEWKAIREGVLDPDSFRGPIALNVVRLD